MSEIKPIISARELLDKFHLGTDIYALPDTHRIVPVEPCWDAEAQGYVCAGDCPYKHTQESRQCEGGSSPQAAVPVTKAQISEAIFGWGLRNDDGHNLSMDDTDEIAEYIVAQALLSTGKENNNE
jgi:hypothetical protein